MEAGYDWILVRSHLRHRWVRFFAMALIGVGVVMLTGSAAYYTYSAWAHRELGTLSVSVPVVDTLPSTSVRVFESTLDNMVPDSEIATSAFEAPAAVVTLSMALHTIRLFPGEAVPARYWANVASYEPAEVQQAALIGGFTPTDTAMSAPLGALPKATRIQLPAINLDSSIKELQVLDLGDARAYETPNKIVGHIPESAASGEAGTGWYFGHLESPIKGEGAIFRQLPEIPNLLRQGQDVFVIMTAANGIEYLYRIYSTDVVPQDSLVMGDLGKSTIALVTCVPPLIYDHRLIVYGELVGQK